MNYFSDFKDNVKLWPRKDVSIDNMIFRAHYRLTFVFILVCTVIVSSRQFVKEHISCISDAAVSQVINSFCFFSSTFTITRLHNDSLTVGTHVAHPGVGPYGPEDEVKYHAYYQWVPFVLFGQALLFYVPHLIWKKLENGRISNIVNNVNASPICTESDMTINGHEFYSNETLIKRQQLFEAIYTDRVRFKMNRDWAISLVACELLNALIIVLQIFMVDSFLRGRFMNLGPLWLKAEEDILETAFPKVTKCTFHKFGPSGSLQTHDALCVMSLNVINEKIYVILWFWFMILLCLTVVGIIWRLLTLALHPSVIFNKMVLREVNPGPLLKDKELEIIARSLPFSDWLFLYYLGKNMDGKMFRRTVSALMISLSSPLFNGKIDNTINEEFEDKTE